MKNNQKIHGIIYIVFGSLLLLLASKLIIDVVMLIGGLLLIHNGLRLCKFRGDSLFSTIRVHATRWFREL